MKHIASVSFGKDSLAMLLRLIEEKCPLDEVVFYNTGMEFEAIYYIRDKVVELLKRNNIKYTELKPKCDFCYKMFEKPVKSRNGTIHNGYSWCGGKCRWGTTEKLQALENYCKGSVQYVGIAVDEQRRLKEESKGKKLYPLVFWNMTEKDCLEYCRSRGYRWVEFSYIDGAVDLYDILDRVSCWCCANKNLKELKNYYLYLPVYWERLKKLQSKTDRPFKNNKYTIFDLEERFKKELK